MGRDGPLAAEVPQDPTSVMMTSPVRTNGVQLAATSDVATGLEARLPRSMHLLPSRSSAESRV